MLGKKSRWIAPLAATAAVLLAGPSAVAAEPEINIIPAADSCKDFAIGITATGGEIKETSFSNGNLYKVGRGVFITWSNEGPDGLGGNGKTYTVNTSGSVSRYVLNPDGKSYTLTLTGHNAFVYFALDRPVLGPGAYQYTGRVVLQVDSPKTNNVLAPVDFTAGKGVDVCALLR